MTIYNDSEPLPVTPTREIHLELEFPSGPRLEKLFVPKLFCDSVDPWWEANTLVLDFCTEKNKTGDGEWAERIAGSGRRESVNIDEYEFVRKAEDEDDWCYV